MSFQEAGRRGGIAVVETDKGPAGGVRQEKTITEGTENPDVGIQRRTEGRCSDETAGSSVVSGSRISATRILDGINLCAVEGIGHSYIKGMHRDCRGQENPRTVIELVTETVSGKRCPINAV